MFILLISLLLQTQITAQASTLTMTPSNNLSYSSGIAPTKEEMQKKKAKEEEEKKANENMFLLDRGVLHSLYHNISDRMEVPGYISLRSNRSLGVVIGPHTPENTSFPVNSTIYLRWRGDIRPEVGDVYSIYTPAIVMQSRSDYTDFKIRQNRASARDDLENYSLAGYLFESNGEIEITDVSRGVIRARILRTANRIYLNDQVMKMPPKPRSITPMENPIRQTAVIVAGYPNEILSTTIGSFIYLNRGKRDGVRVGTIFQTMEQVHLLDAPPIKSVNELGEAMVVYTSDAYSTAIITKQFNVIRVGSLLETVRGGLSREAQFNTLRSQKTTAQEDSGKTEADAYISELDKIEKDADILSLSPEERVRLEKLQEQELRRRRAGIFPNAGESQALPAPAEDAAPLQENEAPALPKAPGLDSSQKQREEARKRRLKKYKEESRKRDEEQLNSLFNN